MGFLSGLFHSRDKPTNSTNGSAYRFLFGGSNSGKAVNERSAMQMTAVYACVRILSESIAGLPVHIYKYTNSGSKEKAINHPLYRLIHDEPNPEMTSFVFRETLMTHLLLYGNAYAQIIRNGKGEVIALYPLMANRMSVDRDDKGHLYYQYQMQDSDAPTMKNGTVILKPSDVLHVPGLGFDGLVGYSPIAMAKNAIGLAIATEEYGAEFFANGATPGGILEYPGTVKNPEAVRESWTKGFSGNNSHKVAVLEEGMKYTPISIFPNEAQFLETRKFQIDEIARIFRVPPHMVGDLEKSSFSNIEQQSLEFVKYTLEPWMIDDCKAGNIDMIITKSISRFARNTLDCLKYIRQLKDMNIPVLFEKESINTMDAKGEVLITIMASLAQQESQSLSQNVKLDLQYRYQQGKVQINHNRFLGYTKDADGNLIIDPEQAEIVKRIYREYLEGLSMDKIAAGLERDGILTGAGGKRWHTSTINKILRNEKYIGDALLQKTYTTDFLNKTRVKNNGLMPQYYVEGNHEAIIPKGIYLQVQEELVRRRVVKTSANGKKRSYS